MWPGIANYWWVWSGVADYLHSEKLSGDVIDLWDYNGNVAVYKGLNLSPKMYFFRQKM